MRCDLHVHSIASGMFTAPVLDRICRESYNDPREVYNRLKRLGMSIVTLTDHDSIEGAEVLRRHPDFFLKRRGHRSNAQRHGDAPGRLWPDRARPRGNPAPPNRLHRPADVPHGTETVLQREPHLLGAHGATRGSRLSVV